MTIKEVREVGRIGSFEKSLKRRRRIQWVGGINGEGIRWGGGFSGLNFAHEMEDVRLIHYTG